MVGLKADQMADLMAGLMAAYLVGPLELHWADLTVDPMAEHLAAPKVGC